MINTTYREANMEMKTATDMATEVALESGNLHERDGLRWFEYGDPAAPALVFLHGLGLSSWMWQEQIDALKADYHCLAIDLPGNGESYEQPWHSFAATAARLADIIRARASGGKAHVVGLSLGGYAALTLLANHPDVVDTMIVSGVSTQPFAPLALWRGIVNLVAPALRFKPVIALSAKTMQLPPEALAVYERDMRRLSPPTIRAIYAEVLAFQVPPRLSANQTPLLAVAGDREVSKVKNGLTAFHRVPNATTALVPNAHHGWNGEHPGLFAAMIRDWTQARRLAEGLVAVPASPHTR